MIVKLVANKLWREDAAGIGKNMLLPGEISRCRVNGEKSAEVIEITGKDLTSDAALIARDVSRTYGGW